MRKKTYSEDNIQATDLQVLCTFYMSEEDNFEINLLFSFEASVNHRVWN